MRKEAVLHAGVLHGHDLGQRAGREHDAAGMLREVARQADQARA
jgi:hypothetical protein